MICKGDDLAFPFVYSPSKDRNKNILKGGQINEQKYKENNLWQH